MDEFVKLVYAYRAASRAYEWCCFRYLGEDHKGPAREAMAKAERDLCAYMERMQNPTPTNFLIGQRVIKGNEICTVVDRPVGAPVAPEGHIWLFVPSRKHASYYNRDGVRALPGGQL